MTRCGTSAAVQFNAAFPPSGQERLCASHASCGRMAEKPSDVGRQKAFVDESAIQPYQESHRGNVLDVLAEAYATTPISVALVGNPSDQQRRQLRTLFELRLPTMCGENHWQDSARMSYILIADVYLLALFLDDS